MRPFGLLGGLAGLLTVALGAFGAHLLREQLSPDRLAVFQTGVHYQGIHGLVLLMFGFAAREHRVMRVAGWLFVVGIVVFSGSLYALALSGVRGFGAITPIGGVCFLLGWAITVYAFASRKQGAISGDN